MKSMRTRICGECRTDGHGFYRGSECPKCVKAQSKNTLNIITNDWIKQGTWEHIDPRQPNMRLNSKRELIEACEKRGLIARAFLKPKSQGKGYEHDKRR